MHVAIGRRESLHFTSSSEEISGNFAFFFFSFGQREVFYQLQCLNSCCAFSAAIPFSVKEELRGDKEAADLSLNKEVC